MCRKRNVGSVVTSLHPVGIHRASVLCWTRDLCLHASCRVQDVSNSVPTSQRQQGTLILTPLSVTYVWGVGAELCTKSRLEAALR